jgi:ApeA N-terminal domain 1
MWIQVPIGDSGFEDGWLGTIEQIGREPSEWTISLVRRHKYGDPHDTQPFGKARFVKAMLDLNKRCTLILPRVIDIDFSQGSPPERLGRVSSVIKCHGLLKGIVLDDYNKEVFTKIRFDSQCFDVWENGLRGSPPLASITDNRTAIEGRELPEIIVPNVGLFKFRTVISRRYEIPNSFRVARSYSVTIELQTPMPIEKVMEISTSFDLLMGFLIGFRPKAPTFDVQTIDDQEGELEISYLEFGNDDITNHFTATHLNGIGDTTLGVIMQNFYQNFILFRKIIYCIDKIRFFSKFVVDNFRVVTPILESYLRKRYKDDEQASYLELKGLFFKLIDSSGEAIQEFCKRHISIRESKALGLKNLLELAIEELNKSGYEIDSGFAGRINDRRGSLFHSDIEIAEGQILDVYDETLAMAAMLMLLAMRDLGLDISAIASRPNAFRDLRRICGPKFGNMNSLPNVVS